MPITFDEKNTRWDMIANAAAKKMTRILVCLANCFADFPCSSDPMVFIQMNELVARYLARLAKDGRNGVFVWLGTDAEPSSDVCV